MAKTTGYFRDYRATRRANRGLPLTDPFSAIGLGQIDRAGKKVETDLANIIRPDERAPKGQGKIYEARRWIADTLEANRRAIARIEKRLATRRGQAKYERTDTIARTKLRLLKKFRSNAVAIASTSGNWAYKKELIASILSSSRAKRASMVR